MEPGSFSVARTLPIDGALVGDVLLRLRRDSAGQPIRWTLGDRGTAEVDASFTSDGPRYTATARLWDASGLALVAAIVEITASVDTVELTIAPAVELTEWWQARTSDLLDLAHAVVDELSEELLWHATRAGVTPQK